MSIFNELQPKISEISKAYCKNFNDDLKAIFECFDKFEEEYQHGRGKAREKGQNNKNLVTTLQSIHEDDDEPIKIPEDKPKRQSSSKSKTSDSRSSSESNESRQSNKRSKNEVDGLVSPEQDKRQKRNASVKAQSIISKQVNVSLSQKLRRDEPQKSRGRRRKEDDKENEPDFTNVHIKQEKVSLPPEPMDTDSLPVNIEVKQELDKDEIAMPPPVVPLPRPRKGAAKEKSDDSQDETSTRTRRNTKTRKQADTDTMPPPAAPVPAPRPTRASARASSRAKPADEIPPEPRPKRTRNKKKVSDTPAPDSERDTTQTQDSETVTPEKPRPKRTRRGQKQAEKEQAKQEEAKPEEARPETPKPVEIPETIPKEERISAPQSPILPQKEVKKKETKKDLKSKIPVSDKREATPEAKVVEPPVLDSLDETRVLNKMDTTVTLDMDKTIVLPNGIYSHAPVTPQNVRNVNNTVVIETNNRETIVLDKQNVVMDSTVVLDKDPKATNISEDNSIMTDDNSDVLDQTPPKSIPVTQPTSAVKEKVQQFEEMASRVTRTKTRAMAKKEDVAENQTPPDKVSKVILSAETLSKMNSLIFNGKSQYSSSASKPRANVPVVPQKTVPASASKVSAINKAKELEESRREKEDARKKKEALLEAKREQQRRKREEKMAAAAAAREAADRERTAQHEAAARDRMERQHLADLGKVERLREAERKKMENARKAAEIEERRRAEELKVKLRLDDELRRDAARRRQIEEAEATKKEAALMAKEIEKRQKEYLEKHRIKQKMEDRMHNTPLKLGTPGLYPPLEPVYMCDGFQYLNSDEDEEPVDRPAPAWSTSKARKQQLCIQTQLPPHHVDRLFSVRVHSPDLREIFPNIDRSRLKRTSSAVWRTPPQRLHALPE